MHLARIMIYYCVLYDRDAVALAFGVLIRRLKAGAVQLIYEKYSSFSSRFLDRMSHILLPPKIVGKQGERGWNSQLGVYISS